MKKDNNYAFIDSQNLHLGVRNNVISRGGKTIYRGNKLDYKKFRAYLRERYGVRQAYIFIGMVPGNDALYTYLQKAGYTLIFKQIAWYYDQDGQLVVKGNVDTDVVLYAAAKLAHEYDKAIFVSGDGDFMSLYQHLDELGKLSYIFVPNRYRYSKLLNHYRDKLRFVSDLKSLFTAGKENKKTRSGGRNSSLVLPGHGDETIIANRTPKINGSQKKNPHKDGTLKGKSSIGDIKNIPKNVKKVNTKQRKTR